MRQYSFGLPLEMSDRLFRNYSWLTPIWGYWIKRSLWQCVLWRVFGIKSCRPVYVKGLIDKLIGVEKLNQVNWRTWYE